MEGVGGGFKGQESFLGSSDSVETYFKFPGGLRRSADSRGGSLFSNQAKKRFYYPDVQVVCKSNEPTSVFQDRPVLVIEVLSPSTRRYDLDEKMSAFLTISGLGCYLVLEQHQPRAIVMRRINGGFLREDLEGIEANIDLPFLDCSLSMRDIYDGIEFTADCVQELELEYEVG
jgi:Uma2 family endonuclease